MQTHFPVVCFFLRPTVGLQWAPSPGTPLVGSRVVSSTPVLQTPSTLELLSLALAWPAPRFHTPHPEGLAIFTALSRFHPPPPQKSCAPGSSLGLRQVKAF